MTADDHHESARAALADSQQGTVAGAELQIERAKAEALLAIDSRLRELNEREAGLLE